MAAGENGLSGVHRFQTVSIPSEKEQRDRLCSKVVLAIQPSRLPDEWLPGYLPTQLICMFTCDDERHVGRELDKSLAGEGRRCRDALALLHPRGLRRRPHARRDATRLLGIR
jgi:hypothetical protein